MPTLDDIAAQLQGYDPQALSVDQVQEFLSRLVQPVVATDAVGLVSALGRVLAQDIISPLNVPPHDNSAMDGFAFDGRQLSSATALQFKVVGTALAGKAWAGQCRAGECVRIMTGAVMPQGLDTVIPQEMTTSTQSDGDMLVTIPPDRVRPGDNRRLMGEDLRQGEVSLSKGELLTGTHVGLLASLGIETISVYRRLKVAYFSTGDEILSLGDSPREGAVYDSNRYTVHGMLVRLGVDVVDLGVVRDDPARLQDAFSQGAEAADAIITSGGVSVGEADHTRQMMKQICAESGGVAFWRIAMRPGRPMAVGQLSRPGGGRTLLFGLPGNPVAVMVTFLAFVRPALLQMMGARPKPAVLLKALAAQPIRKKPGRTEYQRGWVFCTPEGELQVRMAGNQGSGVLSSMVQGNGLVVLRHDQGDVAAGDPVDVMMLDGLV
jgi:molybdopterin molybdotransferase